MTPIPLELSIPSHISILIRRVQWLHENIESLGLRPKEYRRDLIVNAWTKIQKNRKNLILLEFSHNEAVMLERLYERAFYKREA